MTTVRQDRLIAFTEWVATHIRGDEKGEAQVFLDRLFQAFSQPGILEVGGRPEFRILKAKEDGGGTAFADYVWTPVVLIEMKRRGEDLRKHYRQAFDYWIRLAPNRPKYVVLCNFDEFWIFDFDGAQFDTPVDIVQLSELPNRWGPLAFLFPTPEKPVFGNDLEAVTRAAADKLATCFNKLISRRVERTLAQRFILQVLVALFAQDIGLLEKYFVTKLIEDCKAPADAYDLLGDLFVAMNTSGKTRGGRFKGVDYFNGGLFAEPARLELYSDEMNQLREAAKSDWSKVRPEIFGTLFEHSCGDIKGERHTFGIHFTSPVDIMKIVGPTIVEPWREQIETAKTQEDIRLLLDGLQHFTVLDPACGSGNFLYLAYREVKRLETRLLARLKEFPARGAHKSFPEQRALGFVTARQFYGLDINPFAVELAKVTMMIARKLAIDELLVTEPALPLDNLDTNFIATDALIDSLGNPTAWPQADVIIGNPPYLDARRMTKEFGRAYVAKLELAFPEVPRRADHCTYWIRRAHDHLAPCTVDAPLAGRAGLVGTQNIRNNQSRIGGLDYVVSTGTIIEAVDNQPWSGEANVHVSIVNWVKTQDAKLLPARGRLWTKVVRSPGQSPKRQKGRNAAKTFELEMRESPKINSALSDATDVSFAQVLACNRQPKRCFEGQQPGHKGFRLDVADRQKLAAKEDISEVVFLFMSGDDLLTEKYRSEPQSIVDLGDRNMIDASAFPATFSLLRERVLPKWTANADQERTETGKVTGEHQGRLQTWWQLKRRRAELIESVTALGRYIACVRHTKRPVFSFLHASVRPDSALTCFAFADDYSFGIMQSSAHWLWFITKCSKLTERFRYTPDSVFDTFPWPQSPSAKQIEAVAKAGREVRRVRAEALAKITGGLRGVYRTLELPGANPLKVAHAALDAAVLAAYGFSPKSDLLAQLLDLNHTVAACIESGESVTAPGIPPSYRDANSLITDDCIRA